MLNRFKRILLCGYTLTLLIACNAIQSKINLNLRNQKLDFEITKKKDYRRKSIEKT